MEANIVTLAIRALGGQGAQQGRYREGSLQRPGGLQTASGNCDGPSSRTECANGIVTENNPGTEKEAVDCGKLWNVFCNVRCTSTCASHVYSLTYLPSGTT